jgi:hypothetical protein
MIIDRIDPDDDVICSVSFCLALNPRLSVLSQTVEGLLGLFLRGDASGLKGKK